MRPTQLTGPLHGRPGSPHATGAAVAWWASLLAAALSLIAVVALALDVAGVGDVADGVVERAR